MDSKTVVKVYVLPDCKHVVRAFTHSNFIFYDEHEVGITNRCSVELIQKLWVHILLSKRIKLMGRPSNMIGCLRSSKITARVGVTRSFYELNYRVIQQMMTRCVLRQKQSDTERHRDRDKDRKS